MAENMSLADQAVQALSMVKAMDANVDNEAPHRHIVRGMKRVAEQKIAAALREAIDLAWMAQELPALVDGVRLRTMKELAEARARRGFCPKCQAQSLRHFYSDGGMTFRKCAKCGCVAVLGSLMPLGA